MIVWKEFDIFKLVMIVWKEFDIFKLVYENWYSHRHIWVEINIIKKSNKETEFDFQEICKPDLVVKFIVRQHMVNTQRNACVCACVLGVYVS